jgi:hypothetical protein
MLEGSLPVELAMWTQTIKQAELKRGELFCKGLELEVQASDDFPMNIICQERKIQDKITDRTRNVPESEHANEQGQSPAHELG